MGSSQGKAAQSPLSRDVVALQKLAAHGQISKSDDPEAANRVEKFVKEEGSADEAKPANYAVPLKERRKPGCESGGANIHLFLRCDNLCPKRDKPCNSMAVVYSKLLHDKSWEKLNNTEIIKQSDWPEFQTRIVVPFTLEVVRLVRIEVYQIKHVEIGNYLERQSFLGGFESRVGALIANRAADAGWHDHDLYNAQGSFMGCLGVWAEEDHGGKNLISINCRAEKLRYTDVWKRTLDPYFIIYRTVPPKKFSGEHVEMGYDTANRHESAGRIRHDLRDDVDMDALLQGQRATESVVWRSEVIRRRSSPHWKRIEGLQAQELCNGDIKRAIVIEVWDWNRFGQPVKAGISETTFENIYKSFWRHKPLKMEVFRTKKVKNREGREEPVTSNVGTFIIEKVGVDRRFTVLDYVRGGLEIVPLFAVDMTRGNLDPSKPDSLHRIGGDTLNEYAKSIKALCEVFQSYQGPKAADAFPIYGFGAKVPPACARCSHCFSLTGDIFAPFGIGIDGLLDAYHNSARVVKFHGPTRFNEIIQMAADWARPYVETQNSENPNVRAQKYFVLTILTKGRVEDEQATVRAISDMVGFPLSILIIMIGDGRDNFLESLNDEVRAWQLLNLRVNCKRGHACSQVAQSSLHVTNASCDMCGCKVSTCKTRWDCEECGSSLCEKCGFTSAQKLSTTPVCRNMVTCTRFSRFRHRLEDFAASTLSHLEDEVSNYYTVVGAKPCKLDKFENAGGTLLNRTSFEEEAMFARAKGLPIRQRDRGKGKMSDQSRSDHSRPATSMSIVSKSQSEANMAFTGSRSLTAPDTTPRPQTESEDRIARVQTELAKEVALKALLQGVTPAFLKEGHKQIMQAGIDLGYAKHNVFRALEEGIPDRSMQALVENLVETGPDGLPYYKQAMRAAAAKAEKIEKVRKQNELRKLNSQVSRNAPRLPTGQTLTFADSHSLEGSEHSGDHSPFRSEARDRASTLSVLRSVAANAEDEGFSLPGEIEVSDKPPVSARLSRIADGKLCTICLEKPIDVELLPCHHRVACEDCLSQSGSLCPLCRTFIEDRMSLEFVVI